MSVPLRIKESVLPSAPTEAHKRPRPEDKQGELVVEVLGKYRWIIKYEYETNSPSPWPDDNLDLVSRLDVWLLLDEVTWDGGYC